MTDLDPVFRTGNLGTCANSAEIAKAAIAGYPYRLRYGDNLTNENRRDGLFSDVLARFRIIDASSYI